MDVGTRPGSTASDSTARAGTAGDGTRLDGTEPGTMYRAADAALYAGKADGTGLHVRQVTTGVGRRVDEVVARG